MFVSIHIPKTGGTTLGYILDYGARRRIYYDYSALRGEALASDIRYLLSNKSFLESRFDIIHGHFHYSKYSEIFPDAFFVTCLRDPLARTISQYFHILEEGDSRHPHYHNISSGRMGLADFASLPNIRIAQTLFLKGRDIADYHHIAFTEKLAESIYHFQIIFNFERYDPYMVFHGEQSVPNTNPRTARKQNNTSIDQASRDKAKEILAEEYDLYARAIDQYKVQSRFVDDIKGGKQKPLMDFRSLVSERLVAKYRDQAPNRTTSI